MKRVLIGHRGAGKTSLLRRHQTYYPDLAHFDLDAEIEKFTHKKINDYFTEIGEPEFRKTEIKVFNDLITKNPEYVISLGAGFQLQHIAEQTEIIFVSRVTDADGRIFTDRPRLEKDLSPLAEFKKRYSERNATYTAAASRVYHLPEGLDIPCEIERRILQRDFRIDDAYYTLSEQELCSVEDLQKIYKNIELRTDIIRNSDIENLLLRFPRSNWLVSVRTPNPPDLQMAKNLDIDFKFYNGSEIAIVSSHTDDIQQAIEELSGLKAHLKLCPLVSHFSDLRKGFEWQQQDPENRSFLPRSPNGKWLWFRQLSKYFQKINFIRNLTAISDQPSITEWLNLPEQKPKSWAAVLGQPVHFSRSPACHQSWFASRASFFTRVDLSVEEFENNLNFLVQLGLSFAAVTSPLKKSAYEISNFKNELESVNTLHFKNQKVTAANTDIYGFTQLTRGIGPDKSVAIWGGGGTLLMMQAVLPKAVCFSSRAGLSHKSSALSVYDYLIWAAPRTGETQFPPEALAFKEVIDLNYSENSMGLEFAVLKKIRYTSGLEMFEAQALKQRQFWGLDERE